MVFVLLVSHGVKDNETDRKKNKVLKKRVVYATFVVSHLVAHWKIDR